MRSTSLTLIIALTISRAHAELLSRNILLSHTCCRPTGTIWVYKNSSSSLASLPSSSRSLSAHVAKLSTMPIVPTQDPVPTNSVLVDVIFASEATSSPAPDITISEQCTLERPCEGDMTWFEAGLGACGTITDGYTQNVVALASSFMGTKSNDNPYCNRTIMITCIATGRTTSAIAADKCAGCKGFSLDLSIATFLDLADLDVGRTEASWYFK